MSRAGSDIFLFQRILPSYRIPVFKKLYQKHGVIVCCSEHMSDSSLKSELTNNEMPVIKLPYWQYRKTVTSLIQNPLPVLKEYHPCIIISEGSPSYFTLWILVALRWIYKYKLVVWSHGIKFNELDKPFRNLRGKLQLCLFKMADAVLIYSDKRAEIIKNYIADPSKIFVARNTLDTDGLRLIYEDLKTQGKEEIKHQISFLHKVNIIFLGRLLAGKKLDELIIAFKRINIDDVCLHLVGEGPEKQSLKILAGQAQNIIFHGAVFDPVITGKMLFSSDLMVIPGYVGLSVVHAFAFGCPVVTYGNNDNRGPVHSPEVEYIKDNINGIFCRPDNKDLTNLLIRLLNDPGKISEMSDNALETAYTEASISNMISGFGEMLSFLQYHKE